MQELVTGLIGAGGEAVVIDDRRSFQHTAEALEGAFIAFGKDPACLNSFRANATIVSRTHSAGARLTAENEEPNPITEHSSRSLESDDDHRQSRSSSDP